MHMMERSDGKYMYMYMYVAKNDREKGSKVTKFQIVFY